MSDKKQEQERKQETDILPLIAGGVQERKQLYKDLENILQLNELGGISPNVLSHARVGKSGYSAGLVQIDFAHRPVERAQLMKVLETELKSFALNDSIEKTLKRIEIGLKIFGDPLALTVQDQDIITTVLQSKAGKAIVNEWSKNQIKLLINYVEDVQKAATQNPKWNTHKYSFKQFAKSREFRALVGDNCNQFGTPSGLKKWVATTNTALNFFTFADYERNYKYCQSSSGRRDIQRRRNNVAKVLGLGKVWNGLWDPDNPTA